MQSRAADMSISRPKGQATDWLTTLIMRQETARSADARIVVILYRLPVAKMDGPWAIGNRAAFSRTEKEFLDHENS